MSLKWSHLGWDATLSFLGKAEAIKFAVLSYHTKYQLGFQSGRSVLFHLSQMLRSISSLLGSATPIMSIPFGKQLDVRFNVLVEKSL